jgi:hypothetical protein
MEGRTDCARKCSSDCVHAVEEAYTDSQVKTSVEGGQIRHSSREEAGFERSDEKSSRN